MRTSPNVSLLNDNSGVGASGTSILGAIGDWINDAVLRSGGLRDQFAGAAGGFSAVNFIKRGAESILGRDFLRAAIGGVVGIIDATPENNNDDNGLVRGLKNWQIELGGNRAP